MKSTGYGPARMLIAILVLVLGLAVPLATGARASTNSPGQGDDRASTLLRGDYSSSLSLRAITPLAEKGDAFAQLALGVMYLKGWNTPADYVQARKWFNLASSRSPPGLDRDVALECGRLVGKMMTPAQIAEAQALSQNWFSDLLRRQDARP